MSTTQFIIYMATIAVSPLIAVQVSELLQRRRRRHEGRLRVFRMLMSTRAARLSQEHVAALNMMDIEFHGNEAGLGAIRAAWKAYLNHLNQPGEPSETWGVKRDDLFFAMLETMATYLGYSFDPTDLRNVKYFPRGHGELEEDQFKIRKGLLSVLSRKSSLPVSVQQGTPSA